MKKNSSFGEKRDKESNSNLNELEGSVPPEDLEFPEKHVDTPTNSSIEDFAIDSEVLEQRKSMPPLTSNHMLPARNANLNRTHHATNPQPEIESSWAMCVDAINAMIKNKANSYEIDNGSDTFNKNQINIKIKDHDEETITIKKSDNGGAIITIPNPVHSKDFIHDFISNDNESEVRIKNVSLAQAKLFIYACDAKDLHKLKFPGLKSANDQVTIENWIKEKTMPQNEKTSRPSP